MTHRPKAIYPGSFDPFTFGHLDIVERASKVFEEVTILLAVNSEKKGPTSPQVRLDSISELFRDNKGIKVDLWEGTVVDYALKHKVHTLIRGLRPFGDFDKEFQMATMNQKLNEKIETLFLPTGPKYFYISSSLVREIHKAGGPLKDFVPEVILRSLN